TLPPVPPLPPALLPPPAVGQTGGDQTETLSRHLKLERNGSISLSNISGEIVVTAGSGDDVSMEAVKRARNRNELSDVQVSIQEVGGRIDIKTDYPRNDRNVHVSVDYTLVVPSWAAMDVHSVSGNIRVTGVQGTVRADTVSGNLAVSDTPKLQAAKS